MNSEKLVEHVWKYFEIHSQQRMTLFNFFILVVGGIISAIGFCLQSEKDLGFLIDVFSITLIVISFLFYKLDQRTSFLIKRSEKYLIKIEQSYLNSQIEIFSKDNSDLEDENDKRSINKIWTYGYIFKLTYMLVGFLAFFFLLVGHFCG
ncbi:hypothetical protein IC799_01070 [Acinetobacter seifertii]|uniref:RipA family octameric membrane protein n=1 Tax=Acinetobacter seifertii TaxID=1530123 RepID=UPI00168B807D|nr:hypothetical protein [Acinetobacter seifertii]QNW91633.1 hypothetical protein IC799_01070 [Acinetobacter seifertii]